MQSHSQISSPHPLKLGVRKQTLKSSKRQGGFKFSTCYWGMGSWGGLKSMFPRWDLAIGAMRVPRAEDFEGNAWKKRDFHIWVMTGFPGGTSGKAPPCQCRRHKRLRFDPWVRKTTPGKGNGNWLQYSCPENPMDRRACQPTVYRVAKSQTQLRQLSMQAQSSSKCFIHPCYLYILLPSHTCLLWRIAFYYYFLKSCLGERYRWERWYCSEQPFLMCLEENHMTRSFETILILRNNFFHSPNNQRQW